MLKFAAVFNKYHVPDPVVTSQNIRQLDLFNSQEGLLLEMRTKSACLKAVSNEY